MRTYNWYEDREVKETSAFVYFLPVNSYVRYCSTKDTGETQNKEQGLKLDRFGVAGKNIKLLGTRSQNLRPNLKT